LAINVIVLKTTHSGVDFPFPAGAKLNILAFLFVPTLCYLPTDAFDVCAGIGQGTVNVNSGDNRRDYGTWNYQAIARYYVAPQAYVQLLGKYVGRVEQRESGKNSYFSFAGLGIGTGWDF
jgi:hypothetical protein